MKIAFIFCGSGAASWSSSDGITSTLRKLGHTVLPFARGRMECPPLTIESLNLADAILVSGPEHIFLQHIQGKNENEYRLQDDELNVYQWRHELKPPKLFCYHESNSREDRTFGFEDLLSYGDYHFFPAIQDAELFDGEEFAKGRSFWLPIAVDTDVFRPQPCPKCGLLAFKLSPKVSQCPDCFGSGSLPNLKTIDAGFVGLVYPKRQGYLHQMATHMKKGRDPRFTVGGVWVQDVEGTPWRDQAERLAMNYRKIAVFVNLPSYSELLVSKVYEVLACGTFLMTPVVTGTGQANLQQFQHAKHLVYYQPNNVPFLIQTMREFSERKELRQQIAAAGLAEVREHHTLTKFCQEMLAKVETAKVVQ